MTTVSTLFCSQFETDRKQPYVPCREILLIYTHKAQHGPNLHIMMTAFSLIIGVDRAMVFCFQVFNTHLLKAIPKNPIFLNFSKMALFLRYFSNLKQLLHCALYINNKKVISKP